MDAVILAGGRGTRLRPLTDTRPKPLIPFMAEPFVIGLLRQLVQAGVDQATILVGSDASAWQPLVKAGASLGAQVRIQTERTPLDTAGACRQLFNSMSGTGRTGPVLVCNGDILTDLDYAALVRQHREAKAVATIHLVPVPDTSSFGVAVCDAEDRVTRFVEKPPPGTLAANTINGGTYVLDPSVFSEFPGDGPLSFERAVFPGLVDAGELVLGVEARGYWQDLGTPRRYLDGHRAVLEGRCAWPLTPGLRIFEATLVAIHESARVSSSATLGPMAVVGAGCMIGPGARIVDSVLHDRVNVGGGACISGGILGERVQIAARAVLVPGAVLRDHSVVTRVYGR
ncbi:MAG: sugar phosphate nucleotidyltransferase [Egibacteraceae bacterium]